MKQLMVSPGVRLAFSAQPFVAAAIRPALARTVLKRSAPTFACPCRALSRHPCHVTVAVVQHFVHQRTSEKTLATEPHCLTHHSTGPARKAAQSGEFKR